MTLQERRQRAYRAKELDACPQVTGLGSIRLGGVVEAINDLYSQELRLWLNLYLPSVKLARGPYPLQRQVRIEESNLGQGTEGFTATAEMTCFPWEYHKKAEVCCRRVSLPCDGESRNNDCQRSQVAFVD